MTKSHDTAPDATRRSDEPPPFHITPDMVDRTPVSQFEPPDFGPPDLPQIPGYELLKELGRGGMGVVYQARDLNLNRIVALKMILHADFASAADNVQFQREAEAIARLKHPQIVQVYAFAELKNQPFFALEYCSKGSMKHMLTGEPLPYQQAARMIKELARAISYAHQNGIIHRDLKPDNVLVDENGTLKITDFGLAKLDEAGATEATGVFGTPKYMSPEQSEDSKRVGGSTDIWSLGVMLYEMLTGRAPFVGASMIETVEMLRSREPIAVRELQPKCPRDLETICLKCLEKQPEKRYASAELLAEDLRRFQAAEPISARPISSLERAARWCLRNRTVAMLLLTVMVVLIAGATTATVYGVRAESLATKLQTSLTDTEKARGVVASTATDLQKELARSDERLRLAEVRLYSGQLRNVQDAIKSKNFTVAMEYLSQCQWSFRGWEWRYLKYLCEGSFATPVREAGRNLPPNPTKFVGMAYSGDQSRIISGSANGEIIVWDLANRGATSRFPTHPGMGNFILHDRTHTVVTSGEDRTIKGWDLRTGRELFTLSEFPRPVHTMAITSDGRTLITYDRRDVKSWDLQTRRLNWESAISGGTTYEPMAISPDNRWIIFPDDRARVNLVNAETGKLQTVYTGHTRNISSLAFHPDSDRFVSGSEDGSTRLWSVSRQGGIATMRLHREVVRAIGFNLDGTRIISGGADRALVIADTETAQGLFTIRDVNSPLVRVAFGPDQRTAAVVTEAGDLRIYDARADRGELTFHADSVISSMAFHPQGHQIVTGSADGIIQMWDSGTGRPLARLEEHQFPVISLGFMSGDGVNLMSALGDPFDAIRKMREGEFRVNRWDIPSGQRRISVQAHQYSITHATVSPNGKIIATASLDGTCCLWDSHQGSLIRKIKVTIPLGDAAFDPQSRVVALGGIDGSIRLFEIETGKFLTTITGHKLPIFSVVFSPDGTRILGAGTSFKLGDQGPRNEIIVWDRETGTEQLRLTGLREHIFQAEFSPDGKLIGTAGGRLYNYDVEGGEVQLWDANNGKRVGEFPEQTSTAFCIAFSPDGKRFAAGGADRVVHVWDVPTDKSR